MRLSIDFASVAAEPNMPAVIMPATHIKIKFDWSTTNAGPYPFEPKNVSIIGMPIIEVFPIPHMSNKHPTVSRDIDINRDSSRTMPADSTNTRPGTASGNNSEKSRLSWCITRRVNAGNETLTMNAIRLGAKLSPTLPDLFNTIPIKKQNRTPMIPLNFPPAAVFLLGRPQSHIGYDIKMRSDRTVWFSLPVSP